LDIRRKKSILISSPEELHRRLQTSSSCLNFAGFGSGSSTSNSFANYSQPIQNQGSCGSCWDFSTIAQYELNYYLYKNIKQKQSEQYILDCTDNTIVGSCAGGYISQTSLYLANYGSCPSSQYWTYDGNDGYSCYNCWSTKTPIGKCAWITQSATGYTSTSDGYWNIIANAAQYVGLTIGMAVSNDFYYVSSSYPYYTGCGTIIGYHAMAVYGQYYGNYLLLKNSWGTSWGSNGWVWLSKSSKVSCQFQNYVSFNYW